MKKTIIYGPPGTGKTTRLLSILEEELRTYSSSQIAFVSFTNKGVDEGKERAMSKFNLAAKELPYFRTLHSLTFHSAEMKKKDVMSFRDYREFSRQVGMKFSGYYTQEMNSEDDKYLNYILLSKNNEKAAEPLVKDLRKEKLDFVTLNYEKYKKINEKMDFSDMLINFVAKGDSIPVKIAIIDEAQDLTTLQWEVVETAFSGCDRIYIAGDDDQSIYSWSGSDLDYFLNLEGEKVVLDRSYRLPSKILEFSKQFTSMMQTRAEKEYAPSEIGGEVRYYSSLEEVQYTKDESWLLIARTNAVLARYEEDLRKRAFVFKIKNVSSLANKELNQIALYNNIRKREDKTLTKIEESRMYGCLRPDVDYKWPWYDCFSWKKEKINYYMDIFSTGLIRDNTYDIDINTIHGAKGGEADNVVFNLDVSRVISNNIDQDLDNELRCLYVACTRAKKRLHIIYSGGKHSYEKLIRRI